MVDTYLIAVALHNSRVPIGPQFIHEGLRNGESTAHESRFQNGEVNVMVLSIRPVAILHEVSGLICAKTDFFLLSASFGGLGNMFDCFALGDTVSLHVPTKPNSLQKCDRSSGSESTGDVVHRTGFTPAAHGRVNSANYLPLFSIGHCGHSTFAATTTWNGLVRGQQNKCASIGDTHSAPPAIVEQSNAVVNVFKIRHIGVILIVRTVKECCSLVVVRGIPDAVGVRNVGRMTVSSASTGRSLSGPREFVDASL